MAVQSLRQPCWAWALQQDGNRLGSSSSPTSCCRRQLHVTCVAQHQASSSPPTAAGHVYSEQTPACSSATSLPPQPLLPQQQQPHQPPQLQDARQHHSQREPQQARKKQRRLPDQRLLQCIEACATWGDCLQLLQVHGAGLDPMLLSSLCLHTVHLFSAQQQYNTAAGRTGSGTTTPAHPAPTHAEEGSNGHSSSQGNSRADSNSYGSRRRGSSSRSLTEGAAYTQYMQHLSQLALSAASTGGFSPGRFSNVLWCFARCQHKLPPAWMQQYLWQAQQQLDRFPPRNLAQLVWATASLGGSPSQPFLHAFLLSSQRQLQQFNATDLANTLWAFATLGFKPPAPWLHKALAASARCWSEFKPFELSICIWGFAKLGVRFRDPGVVMPAQQHQQQQETAGADASGATAAAAAAPSCSAGAPDVSVGWLLASIALLTPAMGPQEVANLLWGLAVGRAALSAQQVQALGGQVCIILSQALAPSRPLTASLTVSLWALSNLAWRPTLPQARMIVRLLTDALASGTLDMKHASILVHSLGKLKLRPPAPLIHFMMAAMQQGLQGAGMADVLQVLTGCRLLGWAVPQSWWQALYRDGQNALQQGTAAELVHLLATVASIRHVNPTAGWWESFWGSLGVELEAAVAAKGLCRIARTQNMPKGAVSVAAGPLKARAKQHGLSVAPAQRERRCAQALQEARSRGLAADSSSRSSSSSFRGGVSGGTSAEGSAGKEDCSVTSSSSSRSSDWMPHPLCWVAMVEALQIVTNLQGISQQQAAHSELPASTLTAPRACVLLWACVRLSWRPPKVLLWQLLLLVLVDVHSLSPSHLAVALWAVGHMLHKFGRGSVECFKLIQPLALVAQWRLLVGLAGSGRERAKVRQALRYLASEDHRLMSLLMLHGEEQRV